MGPEVETHKVDVLVRAEDDDLYLNAINRTHDVEEETIISVRVQMHVYLPVITGLHHDNWLWP